MKKGNKLYTRLLKQDFNMIDSPDIKIPLIKRDSYVDFLKSTVKKNTHFNGDVFFNEPDCEFDTKIPFENNSNIVSPTRVVQLPSENKFSINLQETTSDKGFKKIEESEDFIIKNKGNLTKIIQLLSDLFMTKGIELKDIKLEKFEFTILHHLIAKKLCFENLDLFDNKMKTKNDLEFLERIMMTLADFIGKKRKEEKLKFIYNHTIKYLKKVFLEIQDDNAGYSTDDREIQFLNHYFEDVAKENGLDVKCFFDPLRNGLIKNPKFKSLTKGYFDLIFSSERFKKDFINHIKSEFTEDYSTKISNKFKLLFKELRLQLKSDTNSDINITVADFSKKLFKNKRCKLPWTMNEIEEAKRVFLENFSHEHTI